MEETEHDVCFVCGADATRYFLATYALTCENIVCEVSLKEQLDDVLSEGNK